MVGEGPVPTMKENCHNLLISFAISNIFTMNTNFIFKFVHCKGGGDLILYLCLYLLNLYLVLIVESAFIYIIK